MVVGCSPVTTPCKGSSSSVCATSSPSSADTSKGSEEAIVPLRLQISDSLSTMRMGVVLGSQGNVSVSPCALTGGKPLFTHWVHGEYMVGSETKYPEWTHWVHFDYFLITFTICPQFAHPNTHWVHVEYFQKVPSAEPAEGGFDLPAGFILINFIFRPQFAHPNTHRAHVEYF